MRSGVRAHVLLPGKNTHRMLGFVSAAVGRPTIYSASKGSTCLRAARLARRRVLRMSEPPEESEAEPKLKFYRVAAANSISGALLGPLLDNYHSTFGALQYNHPVEFAGVTTTWWTPLLFALAGFIIGNGVIIVDQTLPPPDTEISVPKVLITIAAFAGQYYLSGLLYALGLPNGLILVWMSITATAIWYAFDASVAGAILGGLTAVGGPAIELVLINIFGLYSYANPDWAGIPLWILPIYFAGGPAVGNLSRLFAVKL
mmetsp:Transcript_6156/g.18599  ORF Transcript_6156/g.18599 Transcript_6156/m.18599 type:complete len:259 (+) Transcript_6156:84-860(+)